MDGATVAAGWFTAGGILGVALDADTGAMLVTVAADPAADPAATAAWRPAFESGVRPGAAVGGALFPCVSGEDGAAVRVNAGLDAARPLAVAPPSAEYRPAGHALPPQVPRLAPPRWRARRAAAER